MTAAVEPIRLKISGSVDVASVVHVPMRHVARRRPVNCFVRSGSTVRQSRI